MRAAATVCQMLIRVVGPIMIVLGVLFWTGNALMLVPLHMLLGLVVVLLLWILAGLAAAARVPVGLVAFAAVWGLVVPALGVMQTGLLPGDLHWIIQILHLAVGIVALVLAERLARRIKAAKPPVLQPAT
jgi:hypothetical protein